MTKGDYVVHVFIQQAKSIKLPGEDTCDPIIELKCLSDKKHTTSKDDIGKTSVVQWAEHIFFERNNMTKDEIQDEKLALRVMNKGFFKDICIGAYEFDISYLYFQKDHAMQHQWIGLSNPESADFNEITCYVKLSISVIKGGDENVQLKLDDRPASDNATVMMPASIRKQYKQLVFRIFKGEKFPKMDTFGTIDAFIQTTFMGQKLKTKVETMKDEECTWDQEMWIPIQWPVPSDRLVFRLYDYDKVGSNELVGSMVFSIKKIVSQGSEGKFAWLNLYGCPNGYSGQTCTDMNAHPEHASQWKGRILVHYCVNDTKEPEMKIQDVDNDWKMSSQQWHKPKKFQMILEIGSAIALPKTESYKIKVQINDQSWTSNAPIEKGKNYCRFNQRHQTDNLAVPYKNNDNIGKVFVYLMDGSEPVCFWKGPISQFFDKDPKLKWYPFTNDLAIGSVKEAHEAGMIQMKLSISNPNVNGELDWTEFDAWKKPPPKRLNSFKVRIYIYQCKDIPSADDDGSSDCYVQAWTPDEKRPRTIVIPDNNNPIFMQTLQVDMTFIKQRDAPPLFLDVYDSDEGFMDDDDFLVRAIIDLNDCALSTDDKIPDPRWHKLVLAFDKDTPAMGEILCSFALVEDDYSFKIPTEYFKLDETIEYKEQEIEINVLGLRNLQSFGLLPIKKPFIKFNVKSLLSPDKSKAVQNIKTTPGDKGANPNINTLITFMMKLPADEIFCPVLQCDCFDFIYRGFSQPLIGSFTIPIGKVCDDNQVAQAKELEESDFYIRELTKIYDAGEFPLLTENSPVKGKTGEAAKVDPKAEMKPEIVEDIVEDEQKEGEEIKTGAEENKSPLDGDGPLPEKVKSDSVLLNDVKIKFSEKPSPQKGDSVVSETNEYEPVELIKEKIFESNEMEQLKKSSTIAPNQKGASLKIFKKGNATGASIISAMQGKVAVKKIETKVKVRLELEQQREADKKIMEDMGSKAHKNVIRPEYTFDDRLKIFRESNPPPDSLYMALGFNQSHEDQNKQYRRYFPDELENIEEVCGKSPFNKFPLIRGAQRGVSKGLFSMFSRAKTDDSGQISTIKEVGYFKGVVKVSNTDEKDTFDKEKAERDNAVRDLIKKIHLKAFGKEMEMDIDALETQEGKSEFVSLVRKMGCGHLDIAGFLLETKYEEQMASLMTSKTKCLIRVYVIEGFDFSARDIGSDSDPYLILSCGKKKYNESDNYLLDEPNPKFHKAYDFDAEFPGAPPIEIKAMDKDTLFGDDLIGTTYIDLDDRFFSPDWQSIQDKPVEYRQIYVPSSTVAQGVIKLWVEIHPTSKPSSGQEPIDITPRPIMKYQMRMVVWDTLDVVAKDIEGTSDVYARCFFDSRKEVRETDCHYRCSNGKASFNYRLLFDIEAPRDFYMFTIQLWDRDLFASNDMIGEAQIDLEPIFADVVEGGKQMSLNKKYYDSFFKDKLEMTLKFKDDDSFWVPVKMLNDEGKMEEGGKVRISIKIMPMVDADSQKVGDARSEPNHSPFLPPPIGRISFTWNPFKLLGQLVGPAVRKKICCAICCALCCTLLIMFAPFLVGNLFSTLITNALTGK